MYLDCKNCRAMDFDGECYSAMNLDYENYGAINVDNY